MKSSLSAVRQNEAADDGSTQEPSGPNMRPPLTRSSPEVLSDLSSPSSARKSTRSSKEGTSTQSSDGQGAKSVANSGQDTTGAAGADDARLATLREAMNARLLMQQRARRSYGSPKQDSPSPRVAAIQEEESAASPRSINAMLARSSSTESTESTSTVRAGKASATKAAAPFRTPSYPFPYVPEPPQGWSSRVHQPFTTLSPTDTGGPTLKGDSFGASGVTTIFDGFSEGFARAFSPASESNHPPEDPAFPTPNLYDMVLQLNAEPGLEQWWATVTNMMHDHFYADRATVVIPRDSSEIENVPWGQKATFSMNGSEEFVSPRTVLEQMWEAADRPSADDLKRQKLHPARFRPRLEARHSYAGHGREEKEASQPSRPPGPQRTATHAAGITPSPLPQRLPARRFDSTSTQRHSSLGNPDFSSVAGGGVDAGPFAEVFQGLRDLDHEVQPLIDRGGVSRVLERGRVVTVTRDYLSDDANASTSGDNQSSLGAVQPTPNTTPRPSVVSMSGQKHAFAPSHVASSTKKDYEEYEQYPASSWSQSPAPSPAIQQDEDENPFFSPKEQHVEESFQPTASPKDYSQLGQVEAIGVDNASTVIHIPLVHPTISQPMPPVNTYTLPDDPESRQNTEIAERERKAPIAILSILSAIVPFPPNLTHALRMLGPHLATSFATSQQFSLRRTHAVTIRHRVNESGEIVSTAPMTIVPTSLEDIVDAEVDSYRGPVSAGFTSPSDYSGHSPYSSTSSIVGTPGWDPATHGLITGKPGAVTPAVTGSELVDNYFEAKKRSVRRSTSNAGAGSQTTPARSMKKGSAGSENKPSIRKPASSGIDSSRAAAADNKSTDPTVKEEHGTGSSISTSHSPQLGSSQQPMIRNTPLTRTESNVDGRHSQLHSYGADIQTSFGVLPSAELPTPGTGHARHSSYPEGMPPPSERLLRTIIDAVPVQIFTAEPDTGKLTWVNSKFMVYRAQEASDILDDPWQAIHPDDRAEFMSTWHRSLRTAQQLQQKVRLMRFDGSYRWFYVRAAPLKDKKQKIVHWIGTMMDFHEQNLAQETAAKQKETIASEAKYRAIANSSPQIVFAVNRKNGVVFCNTQWVQYSGQAESNARGVGFMDHVHPDDLAKCKLPTLDEDASVFKGVPTSVPPDFNRRTSGTVESSSGSSETEKASSPASSPMTSQMPQRKLSELASTGILKVSRDAEGRPSYSTEVRLKSKDGEYRWHLVRVLLAEPSLQNDQEEETWYGTCTDISDHKALERDLKQTMDDKSRFLSNMSHEIRTPLNGITGMVNFLIDSSLTTEQLEHVNIIRASTEGLRGLINDILDLSKAEAGMIQLNMDWIYVRALIEEVNDLTSAMAIDKGIELNYLVDEDVPPQIKGDRFRIRQILLNIIGNAIKFTKHGEVFIHCSTYASDEQELEPNEQFISLQVHDTGRGFTEQEAEFLFKRFSQIDGSSTKQHGGTGLGLVISKQLAQLHGGDIKAKGEPGKGSTFTCWIKATLPSATDEPPTPLLTPSGVNIPILPVSSRPLNSPGSEMPISNPSDAVPRPASKLGWEQTQSPLQFASSPGVGQASPAASSASSDLATTRSSSLRSERSSASSVFVPDTTGAAPPMKLALPGDVKASVSHMPASKTSRPSAKGSTWLPTIPSSMVNATSASSSLDRSGMPPMYSILVVCALKYSREATVQHIDKTLPKNVPHQITAREHLSECQKMLSGDDPVIFTHIVVVLHDVAEITALMDQVLRSPAHKSTSIVIITDFAQKRKIMEYAPKFEYEQLGNERRLIFVFKPLKPSRFATIFDPQKEREMSLDRNRDNAQQVALTQKQVFEEVTKRLGNRDKRVLLVEDNRTNQLVVMKFLSKVSINVDTAVDGLECTERVFSKPFGYYSIILCDLHMPNKDGYQTCQEIRKWERDNRYPHLPIVALSANVLGDVHEKCVASGFNSYLTKPVDFKELGTVLVTFMDPSDPNKPHEFMKTRLKRRKGSVPFL